MSKIYLRYWHQTALSSSEQLEQIKDVWAGEDMVNMSEWIPTLLKTASGAELESMILIWERRRPDERWGRENAFSPFLGIMLQRAKSDLHEPPYSGSDGEFAANYKVALAFMESCPMECVSKDIGSVLSCLADAKDQELVDLVYSTLCALIRFCDCPEDCRSELDAVLRHGLNIAGPTRINSLECLSHLEDSATVDLLFEILQDATTPVNEKIQILTDSIKYGPTSFREQVLANPELWNPILNEAEQASDDDSQIQYGLNSLLRVESMLKRTQSAIDDLHKAAVEECMNSATWLIDEHDLPWQEKCEALRLLFQRETFPLAQKVELLDLLEDAVDCVSFQLVLARLYHDEAAKDQKDDFSEPLIRTLPEWIAWVGDEDFGKGWQKEWVHTGREAAKLML